MNLKIMLPSRVLVDESVSKIIAEGEEGSFCLLPRHIDFVSALDAGILSFWDDQGAERCAALDHGILVKSGDVVRVSSRSGVLGTDLASLREEVEAQFRELNEHERRAQSALARLESGAIRRFMEIKD